MGVYVYIYIYIPTHKDQTIAGEVGSKFPGGLTNYFIPWGTLCNLTQLMVLHQLPQASDIALFWP